MDMKAPAALETLSFGLWGREQDLHPGFCDFELLLDVLTGMLWKVDYF